MRIGIIGAGNIGGNCARLFAQAGHDVVVSFSRDSDRLRTLAAELGAHASIGTVRDATRCELVVLSVPWDLIGLIAAEVDDFAGNIVIDTTNQFSRDVGRRIDLGGQTAARVNADRLLGARYTKSFNALTSGFQAAAAKRTGTDRVVQWIAGDDPEAAAFVASVILEIGFAPVVLAGINDCAVMEAPRRPGAVYGEEYHAAEADLVVAAVRAGQPIPPMPEYS